MAKALSTHPTEQESHTSTELRAKFVAHQHAQLTMCFQLEAIADSLPNSLDKELWHQMSKTISPVLEKAHWFEELELFPYLLQKHGAEIVFKDVLNRLESEHHNDEDYAESVSQAIGSYVRHGDPRKAESLSWMLRGFFESIRRHIAFEHEHILPFLDNRANQP